MTMAKGFFSGSGSSFGQLPEGFVAGYHFSQIVQSAQFPTF
nr:MAG TPA: hypothetical protein [Caudoviricetes sp.]